MHAYTQDDLTLLHLVENPYLATLKSLHHNYTVPPHLYVRIHGASLPVVNSVVL